MSPSSRPRFNECLHRCEVRHTTSRNSGRVLLADLHAVAPAPVPEGSVLAWLVLGIVLAAIAAAGVFLTARR
jgi:hypothetical protein